MELTQTTSIHFPPDHGAKYCFPMTGKTPEQLFPKPSLRERATNKKQAPVSLRLCKTNISPDSSFAACFAMSFLFLIYLFISIFSTPSAPELHLRLLAGSPREGSQFPGWIPSPCMPQYYDVTSCLARTLKGPSALLASITLDICNSAPPNHPGCNSQS